MLVTNSLTGGGAERTMNLVANELTARGWTISLIPINSSSSDQVLPTCEVFPLERQWRGTLFDSFSAVSNFTRIVNAWNPDVIVLNCDLPELFGAILFGKHKLVVVEHTSNPWARRVRFGKIVRRILEFRNTTWVAVSSHLTIWPMRLKPSKVLQNPVSTQRQLEILSPANVIKRLVFIGRLSQEKRPDLAMEISRLTSIDIVIIGAGLMQEELQRKAFDEAINANFLGQLANPWLEIDSGDLLIVPSAFEGDGLVVLEGLQRKVPMLLADIPDFRRFGFPEKNYCSDEIAFVSRILSNLQRLPELIISSEIANSILQDRTLESIGDNWEQFLNEI